ncbi:hypothetical protein BDN72DRAFT_842990 [Pluteus cervinus]|uniref:Uncharacterized protein n=1 Tax=Pluteus cervinus TaxID=181527 RepID=A0ACD3ARB5_9AGAR|nr:hypothetical protein BDN72DRAFT_842990 [Pluteus cervinus]
MLFTARILALLSLLATFQVGFVAAQDPPLDGPADPAPTGGDTGTGAPADGSDPTTCITDCFGQAARNSPYNVDMNRTDLSCACTNQDVIAAVTACLQNNCPDALGAAQQQQAALCGGAGGSTIADASSTLANSTVSTVSKPAVTSSVVSAAAITSKPPTPTSSGSTHSSSAAGTSGPSPSPSQTGGAIAAAAFGGYGAVVLGAVAGVVGLVL